mgnify:CR=1 FL=1
MKFLKEKILEIVVGLCQYPLLQLELLEKLLEDRQIGVKIDNDLLIINLTLLCKLNYSNEV